VRPYYDFKRPLFSLDPAERRPYVPKMSAHSSRKMVDKIMREGEELIPVHQKA